jgi:DNA-binding beta-propeller fold protein YncE
MTHGMRFAGLRWIVATGLAAVIGFAVFVPSTMAQERRGDCNGDGRMTIDELIIGINIALDNLPLSACAQFDGNGDARVTIDELIEAVNAALSGTPQQLAFVVATDFQTGSFATVSLDEPRTVTPASPARVINTDALARAHGGLVYVINRFGADDIQVLDPARNFATAFQCSTGGGSNPNDIAFRSGTKAYVALFARSDLLIVNPVARIDCSDFVLGSIDLSAYADEDGIPEMTQLAIVGDRLYVSLERLTNFMPAGPGALVTIDTNTDQVIGEITLTGENPFGQSKGLTVEGEKLVVTEVGKFGVNDGGIERVDLLSATAEGFFVTEADLGGDITDFVLISDHLGYAILSQGDFTNALVAFDPTTRMVTQTLMSGGSLSDVEIDDRGELFVADRNISTPGVRIFRASDGTEITTAPLDLGLPPFDIVFVP